jgi:trehalose 6-phosphate phosphatase
VSHPLGRGAEAAAAFRLLAGARTPLLFLDLDGTLAPLVTRPAVPGVPAFTRRAVQRLRAGGATVVLVSGRSVEAVRTIAQMPVDAILGDHGGRALLNGRIGPWLPSSYALLGRAAQAIAPFIAESRGLHLERKDRSIAIHLDLPGWAAHPTAMETARRLRRLGLRVLGGRRVLDVQVPGIDKGEAVRRWLERFPAEPVLYAGDDTTDQDAFHALDAAAITIAVGPRAAGARFRTRDPGTLAHWLARLADARR